MMIALAFGGTTFKAGNTRLEMTADLREKDQHILKSTSMKQQENPADFSSVHKVLDFFAQICCQFPAVYFLLMKNTQKLTAELGVCYLRFLCILVHPPPSCGGKSV